MEYLKLFENHSQYADFIKTEDFVRPNVSHCIEENEVHYNPDNYIKFKDPEIEELLINYMNSMGMLESTRGITYEEAARLTTFSNIFIDFSFDVTNNEFIKYHNFDEFQYFTGITKIGGDSYTTSHDHGTFSGCLFKNITIPRSVREFGPYAFGFFNWAAGSGSEIPDYDTTNDIITGSTIKFLSPTPPTLIGSGYQQPDQFNTVLVPLDSVSDYTETFDLVDSNNIVGY